MYFKNTIFGVVLFLAAMCQAQINKKIWSAVDTIGAITMEISEADLIISWPTSSCFDTEGNLYVLNAGENQILKFNQELKLKRAIGEKGQGPGEFSFSKGRLNTGFITTDNDNNLYVMDNETVEKPVKRK